MRAARHDRRVTQHPRPDRGGQRPQPADVQAGRIRAVVAKLCAFGEREVVEALGVGPQLTRGAGQCLGHAWPEGRLERRQRLVAHPGPGEAVVVVVRVEPGFEAEFGARGAGGGAAHGQQRPAVRAAPVGHPGQRSPAGSAGEPEQDGFRLVIEGVAEQDRGGAVLGGRRLERTVPGRPGRGFRARRRGRRRHRDRGAAHRVQAELAQQRGHAHGALAGTRLQPVVDGHAAGPQAQPRRHERRGRGQRE